MGHRVAAAAITAGLSILFTVSFAQVKVACIGNSITAGAPNTYCPALQTLLGGGYTVLNAGVSARTMLRNGDYPYFTQGMLPQVFANQPAIVTIKLGTNDTKPWNWVYNNQYMRDCNTMIDTLYRTLTVKPKIFLCLPTKIFPNTMSIRDSILTTDMIPMLRLVAAERGLPLIDCWTPMVTHPELFYDGVHPTVPGADSLARIIYRGLTTTSILASPGIVRDTLTIGQTDTTGTGRTITVTNAAITAAVLDSVIVSNKTAWLKMSNTATPRSAQKVVLSPDLSAMTGTAGWYYDTLTLTAANATPATARVVVAILVRQAPVATSISLSSGAIVLSPSQKDTLTTVVFDQYGSPLAVQPAITWQAPNASISSTGIFTAPATEGRYQVFASSGTLRDTAIVIVSGTLTKLTPGLVTRMLLLQSAAASPYIPLGTGNITTNFTGRDSLLKPVLDSAETISATRYTWKNATSTNGIWLGDATKTNFIGFGGLYLYAPVPSTVYLACKNDDALLVRMNATVVVSSPSWTASEIISPPIPLLAGLNRFVFKMLGGGGANGFSFRFVDSLGNNLSDLIVQYSPDSVRLPDWVGVAKTAASALEGTGLGVVKIDNGEVRVQWPGISEYTVELFSLSGKSIAGKSGAGRGEVILKAPRMQGVFFLRMTAGGSKTTIWRMVNFPAGGR